MQHRRKWRARAGTAAALLITALVPTALGGPAGAAASASAASAGAAKATEVIQQAVAEGRTFDPSRAFESSGSAPSQQAPRTLQTPYGTSQSAPANANGGSLAMNVAGSVETPQGPAQTSRLSNGDSVEIYGLGAIDEVRPDGSDVWQRSTSSLYRDWKLTYGVTSYTPTPQLVQGTDVADPFDVVSDEPYVVDDTHIYAVGDLAGDGSTDIAVAENVGINLGLSSCFCSFTFNVPGSSVHLGSFVTVLNAKTGATLYSELDPGIVTQLAIAGNRLIVGDETGSGEEIGQSSDYGQWDSETNVQALAMHSAAGGQLAASQLWDYSTGAQWGRLLGMQAIGGNVAVAWSDTPLGLGVPGPPDGHVVLLDSAGHVAWDQRTAGYPVLSQYDPSRGLLAVVEQTDPTQAVSYSLDGLRLSDGRTVTSTAVDGSMPTALTVGALRSGAPSSWLVAGITTDLADVAPPGYAFNGGVVSAIDPSSGHQQWSATLADPSSNAPQPGSINLAYGSNGAAIVLVGSSLGTQSPTAASPQTETDDLQALSGTSGARLWDRSGDISTPLSLTVSGATVRGVTTQEDAVTYDVGNGHPTGTAPLFGSLYAVTSADVLGNGTLDEIAGGQDGAVYAFDGTEMTNAAGAPNELWRAYVGGTIQQIVPTTFDGRRVLVVASSTGLATIDEQTGRVLHAMPLPGEYVWNVAVGTAGGRTVIATAGSRVSAFDASTGAALWNYQPPAGAYFSDAAIVDGVVVSDYSTTPDGEQSATAMAAVGLDALTGRLKWSAAADPATTASAQLADGVAGGPGIPGAGADGAVFTWMNDDNQGRADVRNVQTGALIYSDTSDDLFNHESYLLSPKVGLVSIGGNGLVSIEPAGPVDQDDVQGSGIALGQSDGTPVLLTSSVDVQAYPLSVLTDVTDIPDPIAELDRFTSDNVYVNADDQVIGTEGDQTERDILEAESGLFAPGLNLAVQEGIVVSDLTGTPSADSVLAKPAQAPESAPAARPSTIPLADSAETGARIGDAQPAAQIEVHGYTASGSPELTSADPAGYSPSLMQSYLGLHGNGAGQTVAVVDAPGNPGIVSDVDQFSAQFGLPPACSGGQTSGCFDFRVETPQGTGTVDPGWGLETSLDIEWIHAIAPQASIDLVEAANGSIGSMFAAVASAAQLRPDAISMSWGMPGEFTDETYYDHFCQLSDSLCVVSTGDYGYPGDYPAYDPSVLAVGGTSLQLNDDGSVQSETAWSNSGGGQSYVEPAPAYQAGVVTGGRGTPDVSFDADPATGVPVYDSTPDNGQSGWFEVGGTSVGAPSWSAILSVTDQLRAQAGRPALVSGTAQQALYGSAGTALSDVTSGDNGQCPVCTAGPGYDFVTGLGSPQPGIDSTLTAVR